MKHNLKTIAQNFQFDIERFLDFGRKNVGKFGIHKEDDFYYTTTFFTDELIEVYKKSLNEKWFSKNILKTKNQVQTKGPYHYTPRELLNSNIKIDYEVELNSGKNLQRGFVWTMEQKRELILSIIKGIPIGQFQVSIFTHENGDRLRDKQTFRIIDGKQRLSTIFDFIHGAFGFIYNDVEYFIDDLETYTKNLFTYFSFEFNIYYEYPDNKLSDEQLIDWFERINFAGTEQDKKHLINLKNN